MTERLTIYYDEDEDGDLEENLQKLRVLKNSPFRQHKKGRIAGMILPQAVRDELKRLESRRERK